METMNPQRNSVSLKQKKCEENYAKAWQNQTLKIKEREILTGSCNTACGILLISSSARDQTPAPDLEAWSSNHWTTREVLRKS